ncbi:ALQxL family class IV lanthipeptide [Kitasatospora paranensis]|uniref:ALQxL family class IV lanthipeptide n=1 Tax=Kitasatospora paranensis TaxID=258053 RepID=A0ABW2FTU5_9ACTN
MELDLDALQELPADEELAGACGYSCSVSCPSTCHSTGV